MQTMNRKPRGKLCFETTRGYGFPIKLHQQGKDKFSVLYGVQLDHDLSYGEAAAKLGQALMHALACEGNLDNRERGER